MNYRKLRSRKEEKKKENCKKEEYCFSLDTFVWKSFVEYSIPYPLTKGKERKERERKKKREEGIL